MLQPSGPKPTLSERTQTEGRALLTGENRSWRGILAFVGPAAIASIAYIDPGNFATNIQAGAKYNYELLWVVVLANLIAMLFQALSAKLGIVTGKNLAELCRDHLPPSIVYPMWIISEVAAMATDLAELVGAAIGFSLLLQISLMNGLLISILATIFLLTLQKSGFRLIELMIGGFVGIVTLCYIAQLAMHTPDWSQSLYHAVVPTLANDDALLIAVGIIGATVMPHAIYLHSSLTQNRIPLHNDTERKRTLRYSNREVFWALSLTGLINIAIVLVAAVNFHSAGLEDIETIDAAYHALHQATGNLFADIFLTSLIASGLASSMVGTMAGQVIMQGFVGFSLPLWLRRAITIIPSLIVVACGIEATRALVLSQVVLSLALPIPMIALLWFSRRQKIMGEFRSSKTTQTLSLVTASIIVCFNIWLVIGLLFNG